MRRSEKNRHPFFEGVVFVLALCLAGILAFYGIRGFLARRAMAGPPVPIGPLDPFIPGQAAPAGSATESSVTGIPPVKLVRTGGLRNWRSEVPSPTGSKKK